MKSITLLEGFPQSDPKTDIGLLFECSVDSSIRKKYPQAVEYKDLIGDIYEAKEKAAMLARILLDDEPRIRGVRQLEVFEEVVIKELKGIFHSKCLRDYLIKNNYKKCIFESRSQLSIYLETLIRLQNTELELIYEKQGEKRCLFLSDLYRSVHRLQENGISYNVIKKEFQLIINRIDPYHLRRKYKKKQKYETEKIWFYSTASTYTNIGMHYESWFPDVFVYLVENPLTGGGPLTGKKRKFFSPYDFVVNKMIPSNKEIFNSKNKILIHIKHLSLTEELTIIRDVFIEGAWYSHFNNRLLSMGMFNTALFQAFVDTVKPKAVVVGNPVFESYVLHAAKKNNIPTILLQHGTLGDFCQFIDPPIDHYIVRGRFWKEFLSKKAAERANIINPPQKRKINNLIYGGVDERKNKVIFLTADNSLKIMVDDILEILIVVCEKMNIELVVRVHPIEQIGYYKNKINKIIDRVSKAPTIHYSQGVGLEVLLDQALVAVTYASTVFLDCLRKNVPVISYGWYEFSYKKQIEKYGVFHFCNSLHELASMIERAVSGDLQPYASSVEPFLAECSDSEVRCRFSCFVKNDKV